MADILLKVKLDSTSYQKDIAKIEKSLTKLGKSMPKTATTNIDSLRKSYANLLNTIKNTENKYPKGTFDKVAQSAKSALTQLKGLDKTQADYDQHLQKLSDDLTIAQRDFAELRAEVDHNTSAVIKNGDSILSMAKKFVVWQAAATLVMQPLNAIKNAVSSINETLVETEDRIIELKRVLPTGSVGDSEMASQLYDLAAQYGQTFENVSDIALNFARTGMSWADTIKATEAAVLALNVAELDASQSSNGMIAIMQQFGYEASDLTEIIDKLNKTADNYAVTTDKLLTALQRTGSSAKNARLELDQTIGVITALSEATGRSGENLGTAVNSLIQFSTKSQSLETFAKLSDNMAKIVEDYQHGQGTVLDIWQGLSAEIQKSSGNSESILSGLFGDEDWRTLNAELQEQLGENFATVTEIYDTASTFRKNYFIALLNNMDTVQDSINTMQGSLGYSQKENEQYLDTYTAKLNTLNAQWQEMANSEQGILGIKKVLVDFGSAILTVNKWTGGLTTTFIALGGAITAVFGQKTITKLAAFVAKIKESRGGVFNLVKAIGDQAEAQVNASFATDRLRIAQEQLNIAKQKGIGIEEAQAAVTKAETAATEANTAAKQANAMAISSVLTYATLFITAISAIVGLIKESIRQQEESRRQTIENYRSIESTYKEVQKLATQYKELADITSRSEEQEKDFKDIEEKLVDTLNDKRNVLALLKEGTDEYREAVQRLAEEEQKEYERNLITAQTAASKTLANTDVYGGDLKWQNLNHSNVTRKSYDPIRDILENAGLATGSYGNRDYLNIKKYAWNDTVEAQLYNYSQFKRGLDALQKEYNKAAVAGDTERADMIAQSDAWQNFKKAVDDSREAVKDYFDTTVALNTVNYQKQFGTIKTQEDFDKALEWITEAVNAGEYYNDTIKNILAGLVEIKKTTPTDDTDKWVDDLSEVSRKYDKIVSAIEKMRDADKEALDYEEKKKSVLEAENELLKAQQALENAKNEATVRRFNQATGQWEWQFDEKKVQAAEENLKKQEESLEKARLEVEKAAYDDILKELDKDHTTNEQILAILAKWAEAYGSGDFSGISNDILKIIHETGKVNIGDFQHTPTYDSGGVLHGLGGIKATAKDEIVLPPEIASKILQPTSNAQFKAFCDGLGILFGSPQISPTTQVERVGGNIDNRVNNSGQVFIQGVNVGTEKRDGILDALALAPTMSDN